MTRLLPILLLAAATGASAADVDCFASRPDAAAYVAEDGLVVQSAAGADAPRVQSTSFGDPVCVLRTEAVRGQAWALVRTYAMTKAMRPGQRDMPGQGWIPARGLVALHELAPLRATRRQSVEVDIGDSASTYAIDDAGRFDVLAIVGQHACRAGEAPDEYGACNDRVRVRGRLRGARSLVVAARTADVFRLLPDGRLCPERGAEPPAGCPPHR